MKKILKKTTSLLLLFIFSAQGVFADSSCTYEGQSIPCSEMPLWVWVIMGSMIISGLAVFLFWAWMLIDAIKYEEKNKLVWVIIMLFANFLGAVIYYFVAKRQRGNLPVKSQKNQQSSTPMGAQSTGDMYYRDYN